MDNSSMTHSDDKIVEAMARAMAKVIGDRHGHDAKNWLSDERREEARAALSTLRSLQGQEEVTEEMREEARRIVADHYEYAVVENVSLHCAEVEFVLKGMLAMRSKSPLQGEVPQAGLVEAPENNVWKRYAADFDAMTDEEVEREAESCRNLVEENEDFLEAVASWEAAGKPRTALKETTNVIG